MSEQQGGTEWEEPHYAEITASGSGDGIATLLHQTASFYKEESSTRFEFTLVVKEKDDE